MIHLNQAGTSWPKPSPVITAAAQVLEGSPASWRDLFHESHARVARGLGIEDASRLLLTPGCTSALAVAIADLPWERGDRMLMSGLEHHAVTRPAALLEHRGVSVHVVPQSESGPLDLDALQCLLEKGRVRLLALTAACNVTGDLLPCREAIELAHAHDVLCLVDGAQICGYVPVDLADLGADFFTFAGHKGLHAPWGVGGLYVAPHVVMRTPAATCEVPIDGEAVPCAPMPGYCDVGSADLSALAGLVAGMDWLDEGEQADLPSTARQRVERVAEAIEKRPGARLIGARDPARRLPTVAFVIDARRSADVAMHFRHRGILVASGLQCAPLAHETLGTAPDGVTRISAGPFADDGVIEAAVEAIQAL